MLFNHAVTIAFTVLSRKEDGSDITPELLRKGVDYRMQQLGNTNEWLEACLPPYDTYEMDRSDVVHWAEQDTSLKSLWRQAVAFEHTTDSFQDWAVKQLTTTPNQETN